MNDLDKLRIFGPPDKRDQPPLERLEKPAREQDRSVIGLVGKALVAFVERERQTDGK